jgi:hypothetical protein
MPREVEKSGWLESQRYVKKELPAFESERYASGDKETA